MDLTRDKKIERLNMSFKEWLEDTNYKNFMYTDVKESMNT